MDLKQKIEIQKELIKKIVGTKFKFYNEENKLIKSSDFNLQLQYMNLLLNKAGIDYIDIFENFVSEMGKKLNLNNPQEILKAFTYSYERILSEFIATTLDEEKGYDYNKVYDEVSNEIRFINYKQNDTICNYFTNNKIVSFNITPEYSSVSNRITKLKFETDNKSLKDKFKDGLLLKEIGKEFKRDNIEKSNFKIDIQAEFVRNLMLLNKTEKEFDNLEKLLSDKPKCFEDINQILEILGLTYLDIIDEYSFKIEETFVDSFYNLNKPEYYISRTIQDIFVNNLLYQEMGEEFFDYIKNSTNKYIDTFEAKINNNKLELAVFNDNVGSEEIVITPEIVNGFKEYTKSIKKIFELNKNIKENILDKTGIKNILNLYNNPYIDNPTEIIKECNKKAIEKLNLTFNELLFVLKTNLKEAVDKDYIYFNKLIIFNIAKNKFKTMEDLENLKNIINNFPDENIPLYIKKGMEEVVVQLIETKKETLDNSEEHTLNKG